MNKARHIFFPLALVCLMLLKVSAFHIYTHHSENDDHIECQICDLVLENQSAEVQLTFTENIIVPDFYLFAEPVEIIDQDVPSKTSHNLHLFLRPPPVI